MESATATDFAIDILILMSCLGCFAAHVTPRKYMKQSKLESRRVVSSISFKGKRLAEANLGYAFDVHTEETFHRF